jgi:hypothetical protein
MSLLDQARAIANESPPCSLAKGVLALDEDTQQQAVELLLSEVPNRAVTVVLNKAGVDIAETTIRHKRKNRCKCEWCQENLR